MAASLREFEFSSSSDDPMPRSGQWSYDVFLSFRGNDTRCIITSHIYQALKDAGIKVFIDSVELPKGDEISLKLRQAIQSSRFAVVILSRNYADSKWCLQELEEIMKWKGVTGQVVLPVFYGVEPSHVRTQLGPFRDAFVQHESTFVPDKVNRWRKSLTDSAKLSGFAIGDGDNEAEKIQEITRVIMAGLNADTCLRVASLPVGLDSRLAELPARLSDGTDGVYFLGIVGMAGAGKTSLAKAIYNKLFRLFQCKSFLPNVGGKSTERDYIFHLQEQLLLDTTNFRWARDNSNIIARILSTKKVLLVLDGVNDLNQIQYLAGGRQWFGPGSRIIVTTRYPDLLNAIPIHLLDDVYDLKPLTADESLELLCGHSFGEISPREEFREVSKQVVSYCKGIPLALEAVGGSLAGKTTEYWKNTLDQLKTIPHERIQARLETSYDSLGNDRLQELFLDIACFFVGWDKDYVVMVLEACGLFAKKGIQDLIGKCLVQVDEQNKLQMHEFLRDMGREIVRRQSPNNPGNRSRLWCCEDILTIFRSDIGTIKVEGVALNSDSVVKASAKAFKDMKLLRVLQLKYLELHGEYGLISKELRLLHWHYFFNKFIPDDFYLEQLVVIDMQHNMLIEVFQDNKVLPKLKILNLSYSHSLTNSPNFSKFPNLEKLILKYCGNLVKIHPSIGNLRRITTMNFRGCSRVALEEFPETMGTQESLEHFVFSREEPKMRKTDSTLRTEEPKKKAPIKYETKKEETKKEETKKERGYYYRPVQEYFQVHEMGILQKKHLQIIPVFRSTMLKALKLVSCRVEDSAIPTDLSGLIFLEYLDLRRNKIRSLPDTISTLPKLKYLRLDGCGELEMLPDMPPSLICLSAVNCRSLRRVSMPHFDYETRVFLTKCTNLRSIDGLQKRSDRKGSIHLEMCFMLEEEFKEFLMKDWCGHGRSNVFLLGTDIPQWFHYRTKGSSLSITTPPSKELTICVIYSADEWQGDKFPHPKIHIHPLNISYTAATYQKIAAARNDHLWVFHLPESFFLGRLDSVNELTVVADFGLGWPVKGIGAYFPGKVLWNNDECGKATVDEGTSQVEVDDTDGVKDYEEEETGEVDDAENKDTAEVENATLSSSKVVEACEEEDRTSIFVVLLWYSIIFGVCWILWRRGI